MPEKSVNIYRKTIKPNLIITALASATVAMVTWGKGAVILGLALSTPWLAFIVALAVALCVPLAILGRDKLAYARAQKEAEDEVKQTTAKRAEYVDPPNSPNPPIMAPS